jgi:hypothetical protein
VYEEDPVLVANFVKNKATEAEVVKMLRGELCLSQMNQSKRDQ